MGFFLWPVIMNVLDKEMTDVGIGEVIGYIAMLVALSMVFFGVRAQRNQSNGIISFKKAFVSGLVIVLIASFIYVLGWMLYYPNFMPDFADEYFAAQIETLKSEGLAQAELQAKIKELEEFKTNYEKPTYMIFYTFMEIFPIGLIVAIISAIILKRKSIPA